MTIIEKEIAKREHLICDYNNKLEEIIGLEGRLAQLKEETQHFGVDEVLAEITELQTYLPKVEEVEEECEVEVGIVEDEAQEVVAEEVVVEAAQEVQAQEIQAQPAAQEIPAQQI